MKAFIKTLFCKHTYKVCLLQGSEREYLLLECTNCTFKYVVKLAKNWNEI